VNNPEHYNRQGIEVIDVIEAYDLPYHLGNVIKYILRHEYKGNPRQDLEKAAWYLDRYLGEEWDDFELGYSESECQAFFDGYDLAKGELAEDLDDPLEEMETGKPIVTTGLPDSIMVPTVTSWPPTIMHTDDAGVDHVVGFDDKGFFIGTSEVDEPFIPYVPSTHPAPPPPPETFVQPSESRIAGDTSTAVRLKNDFYGYNPDEVISTCSEPTCGKDITGEGTYLAFTTEGRDYCSYACYSLRGGVHG
jgi:hypothetical protein